MKCHERCMTHLKIRSSYLRHGEAGSQKRTRTCQRAFLVREKHRRDYLMEPSIGENVSNGAGEGLEAFARTGGRQTHGVVEGQMAFIEGVRTSRERGIVETIPRQSLCNRHMVRQRPPR